MLRQGMRRCAQRASCATGASQILRQRFITPTSVVEMAAAPKLQIPVQRLSFAAYKAYSTTADAASAPAAEQLDEEKITFRSLEKYGVHENLLQAIIDGMGYQTMSQVQAKTIEPALKGTDIVAQAKTGTGKTIAFLLPLLQRMILEDPSLAGKNAAYDARSDDIRGIILSPTRELAEQIAVEAKRLTKDTGLVVQVAVGGTSRSSMLMKTQREGCHIMVATPGRLNDLLRDERSGIDAPRLASLVLDEADRMLDVGFERELNEIIDMLPTTSEKVRQTMLVSATIPDSVIRLARNMVRPDDFEFVQTIPEHESLTHEHVPQFIAPVSSWTNMYPALFELIERETEKGLKGEGPPFKAIVYFNTTASTELAGELGFRLRSERLCRIPTFEIQSQLSQHQRQKAAEMFRKAQSAVLFSSDVTARGMDFPNVTHVIQVDVPRERETYIHRLGRTGRQNKQGQGWLLVSPGGSHGARRLLRGLPLQQDTSLDSATAKLDHGELTRWHQNVLDVGPKLSKDVVTKSYKVTVSATKSTDVDEVTEDLNDMVTRGFGWPNPPIVSGFWAKKIGLPMNLLNIGQEEVSDRFDGRTSSHRAQSRGGFGSKSGGYGSQGGGYGSRRGDNEGHGRGGRSDRGRPRDPFERMGRDSRRDF